MFVYDGGTLAPDELPEHSADPEVDGLVYVACSGLDSVTIPRLATRIRNALAARDSGAVHELVNGTLR